ncbi:hypothetical protein NO559_07760 [Dasania sp. GY-MA-18]|uniref:Uncharacterized protein n=1 Tax=Dasania phycosphaerae TaxID=2950436 RepID=A0A9J6RKZ1_9GAMM|nr:MULTISPECIES: hypothetical protein [Dasania]MCR8922662.1 hypothetical protein [Dasania sp. GY-MA-18]MCZ0865092.1 hypothetical protein [Dasania phycosphaerae]MCZ0868818.1 hypothetical protein [Dasania phycosphaerae]
MSLKSLLNNAGPGDSKLATLKTGAAHFRTEGAFNGHTVNLVDVSSATEEVLQSFTSPGKVNINLFPGAEVEARVVGGTGDVIDVLWQHRLQGGLMPAD